MILKMYENEIERIVNETVEELVTKGINAFRQGERGLADEFFRKAGVLPSYTGSWADYELFVRKTEEKLRSGGFTSKQVALPAPSTVGGVFFIPSTHQTNRFMRRLNQFGFKLDRIRHILVKESGNLPQAFIDEMRRNNIDVLTDPAEAMRRATIR